MSDGRHRLGPVAIAALVIAVHLAVAVVAAMRTTADPGALELHGPRETRVVAETTSPG